MSEPLDINDERIEQVVQNTVVLRQPKQRLSTFGTTNIHYYLVSEPSYADMQKEGAVVETVIREGRVIAEKPRIVTPYYLSRLDGFGPEARRYFEMLIQMHGASTPGLFYAYKNQPQQLNIVSDSLVAVVTRLNQELEQRGDPLVSIIKGQDDLWDVSLMKFVYEMTRRSIEKNLRQLNNRGLLDIDPQGVPFEARLNIEKLFFETAKGEREPAELKTELEHWDLFEEYQDRFLSLFKK